MNNRRFPHSASDLETINRLTREFWDTRRQITAAVAQTTAITRTLKDMGAPLPQVSSPPETQGDSCKPFIDSILSTSPSHCYVVLEARLQMVELELKNERRKRREAEEALRDVQRECKEPFVVSALLNAFIGISQLTTDALNCDGKEKR